MRFGNLARLVVVCAVVTSCYAQQPQPGISLSIGKSLPAFSLGKIALFDGVIPLGTTRTESGGNVTVPTALLAPGTHRIRAIAWGTGDLLGSTEIVIPSPPVSALSPAIAWPTGITPKIAIAADLSGTGSPDLILAGDGKVAILHNSGSGQFGTPTVLDGLTNPVGLAVADFDGSGPPAIAVAGGDGQLWILKNGTASESSLTESILGFRPAGMTVADFNGDGIPDLAVSDPDNNAIRILQGKGDGTFTVSAAIPAGGSQPRGLVVGDFNADGIADLAAANFGSNDVSILTGDDKSGFGFANAYPTGNGPAAIALAGADLVVWNSLDDSVSTLPSTGNGGFGPGAPVAGVQAIGTNGATVGMALSSGPISLGSFTVQAGSAPVAILVADLNGDGAPDIAEADANGVVSVALSALSVPAAETAATSASGNPGSTPLQNSQTVAELRSPRSDVSSTGTTPQQIYAGMAGITTFPGTQTLNYSGPVAIDGAGNLYIGDYGHCVVLKVTGGVTTTVAGNGTCGGHPIDGVSATTGPLSQFQGIAVDSAGNLYIADTGNGLIRKVNGPGTGAQAGEIFTVAGNFSLQAGFNGDNIPATSASLYEPTGVAVDAAGNIYIADQYNARIRKVNGPGTGAQTGLIFTVAGNGYYVSASVPDNGDGGPATSSSLGFPTGVAVDSTGNIYFSDEVQNCIRKVTLATGIISTVATANVPQSIALDGDGTLFLAQNNLDTVEKLDLTTGAVNTIAGSGVPGYSGDGGAATSAELLSAQGLAVDYMGNLYIGDEVVRQVTPILLNAAQSVPYGSTVTLSATGGSGSGEVEFANQSGGSCYVTGSTLVPVSVGTCTVTAAKLGDQTYAEAISQPTTITVTQASQTIVFQPTDLAYGSSEQLSGTATSGLPLTYKSLTTSICSVNGNTLTTVSVGSCEIEAQQPGNSNYQAATSVDVYVNVTKVSQTIAFGALENVILGSGHPTVSATATSGLTVTFSSTTQSVCTVADNTVTLLKRGLCSIVASQTGGTDYSAAAPVTQSFDVTALPQQIAAGSAGINTFAGPGQFGKVQAVATDGVGNIYVADYKNQQIYEIAPSGTMTTIAGTGATGSGGDGGQATSATFDNPYRIALDQSGNIFVADFNNQRIRKIAAATGVITTVAGTGTAGYNGDGIQATSAEISFPTGVAVDSSGNLYIAEYGGNRVRKVSTSGVISTVAGTSTGGYNGDGIQATGAQLNNPVSVSPDSSGNIYIADSANARVRLVTAATGVITTVAGNGTQGFQGDNGAATSAELNIPWDLALDAAGNLVIADNGNSRVRKVTGGTISTIAGTATAGLGGDGGSATAAELSGPNGLAFDLSGNLYVADTGNTLVRIVYPLLLSTTAPTLPFGGSPATLSVAGGSGTGTVSYALTSGNASCTLSGNTVTALAPGACVLNAAKAADSTYVMASSQPLTITVVQGSQTITFPALNNVALGSGPVTLTATAGSGLSVAFTSATNSVCTVSGNTVTLVATGTCIIDANQAGNANYSAAPQVQQSFTVLQTQAITFAALSNLAINSGPVTLTAAATSGLPVAFTSATPSVCTVSGNTLTLAIVGTCTIHADQAGNGAYASAPTVSQSFTVLQTQTITFAALSNVVYGSGPITLSATASSGLTVAFTSTTPSVCTVSGNTVTLVATGTCSINASQAGNATYASTQITRSFTVLQTQTITFGSLANAVFGSAPILTGSASSGLTVTFSSTTTGTCTISGSTVTTVAGGACTINADQSGNTIYAAASTVSRSFTILPGPQPLISGAAAIVTVSGSLNFPAAVAVDSAGNLYIANSNSNKIREVTASTGVSSVVAGSTVGYGGDNGPATSAKLKGPTGVAVDSAGNIYIADTFNNRIRMVTAATGFINTVAGNGNAGGTGDGQAATSAELDLPGGVAVDGAGNIYIADTDTCRIREVTAATGVISTVAGTLNACSYGGDGGAATSAKLSEPQSVALDSAGNIYIADTGNNRIRMVSAATGIISTVAGNGTAAYAGDGAAAVNAQLDNPIGVAVDSAGNIYIADNAEYRVRMVTAATGIITTVTGNGTAAYTGDGGIASNGKLNDPYGVGVDSAGNLYIADAMNNAIRGVFPILLSSTSQSVAVGNGLSFSATGGSGTGAVSYAVTLGSANCSVSGDTVTATATGSCTVVATKAADQTYLAATSQPVILTTTIGSQTITFPQPANVALSIGQVTLTATATSNLTVSFTSETTGICTISGNTATLVASGTCVIDANQAGNANYSAAAQVQQSFAILVPQTITFPALNNVALGSGPVTLTATAGSGLSVAFTSATNSVCTVSGNTVTLVATGTCIIDANQAGNANYSAAPQVQQSFTVLQTQAITFAALNNIAINGGPVTLTATASSGLPVAFTSATPSVCTVSGNTLTLVVVGTCTVHADQAGNGAYASAPTVSQSFTVLQTQTITFAALSNVAYGSGPITLSATASSGLTVAFTSTTPSVCTVSGNAVTLVEAGTCIIDANQAGNAGYSGAPLVQQSFTVLGLQTITFTQPGNVVFGSAPVNLTATASSGLTVAFTSATTAACTVSGSTVTPVATGTCTISADQSGNAAYVAASTVSQSFTILPGPQPFISGSAAIATVVGSKVGNLTLFSPDAVAVDNAGNIYVANTGTFRVRVVWAATGTSSIVAGTGASGYSGDGEAGASAMLAYPTGLAVDGAGNVYIADAYNNRIRMVAAATGIITTVAGNGNVGSTGDGSAATRAELSAPLGVAVDSAGNLYIADTGNNRIRMVTAATGIITTVAGNGIPGGTGDAGAAIRAELSGPSAIAPDSAGNIYIADTGNNRIRRVTVATGVIGTVAGNGNAGFGGDGAAATSAQISAPQGIAADSAGNMYIGDNGNNRIREVSAATGIIATLTGNGTAAYTGDGGVATNAELNSPLQIALDSAGNVYIADTLNNAIRGVFPLLLSSTSQSIAVGNGATLSATGGSGTGAVSYAVTLGSPNCSISGNTVTATATGSCTVAATEAADQTYLAAASQPVILTVTIGSQTIAFPQPANVALSSGQVNLTATATSNLTVSFTSATTGICTVSGNTVTLVATGACTINANQAGNANYSAAAQVQKKFTVLKAQTITFPAPANAALGSGPVTLNASSDSGLGIAYTSTTTNVCTVSGNTVTLVAAGTCTINANQAGNSTYAPAALVQQGFTVLASQTIAFTAPGNAALGSGPVTLAATATSGLAVSFTSTTTSVCTVSGNTVTLVTAGTCMIDADQVGNASYSAAPEVQQSFNVTASLVDMSGQVKVTSSGLTFSRATQTYSGTVTVVNTGTTAIPLPVQLVFTGLTAGATLKNATGTVVSGPYAGFLYITVSGVTLAPGASLTQSVSFAYTGTAPLSYVVKTLSGSF